MSKVRLYLKFSLLLGLINIISPSISPAQVSSPSDSSINIQNFTPSVLLRPEQWEVKVFSNLYTQTRFFQGTEAQDLNSRQSFLTLTNQVMTGISPRLNIGLEFWINATLLDEEDASPFKTYAFPNDEQSRVALSYFGPKIKIAPIKSLERFAIQSTFLFPIGEQLSGNDEKPDVFVADDRYLWINQFFFDRPLGAKWQLFTQLATWITFHRNADNPRNFRRLDLPISVFVSFFPSPRWTLFVSNEFWPRFNQNQSFTYFMQPGLGLKFQILPGLLEAESSYTNFILGKDEGAGSTFNIGLRLIGG